MIKLSINTYHATVRLNYEFGIYANPNFSKTFITWLRISTSIFKIDAV